MVDTAGGTDGISWRMKTTQDSPKHTSFSAASDVRYGHTARIEWSRGQGILDSSQEQFLQQSRKLAEQQLRPTTELAERRCRAALFRGSCELSSGLPPRI